MQKRYILGIDEGTTGVRVVLYDTKQKQIIDNQSMRIQQYYPKPGWVEHDAEQIWKNTLLLLKKVCKNVDEKLIYGIGITNQRETVVAWDSETGKPICKAIVWQCRRTAEYVEKNLNGKKAKMIKKITGLLPDAYFSATKIKWILENVATAKELLKQNRLRVGTMDCFLAYKLTNGKAFVTDASNASRTMLYNIITNQWDDKLLELFNIPKSILPEVIDNDSVIGTTDINGTEIIVAGMAGDQQSSLFGQACFFKGDMKNTYGTGSFMLLNLGDKPKMVNNGLLTTIAWRMNGKTTYALEGSVFNSGSCVTWLREKLHFFKLSADSEEFAQQVDDTDGVFFVPALTGLGAPYWDSDARGMITGITRGTNANHITRAVLESVAFSTKDVYELMVKTAGVPAKCIRFDGGVSDNGFVMQLQSELFNHDIDKSKEKESTVMGAIFLCGLATKVWKDVSVISNQYQVSKVYKPTNNKDKVMQKYKQWKKVVQLCLTKGKK